MCVCVYVIFNIKSKSSVFCSVLQLQHFCRSCGAVLILFPGAAEPLNSVNWCKCLIRLAIDCDSVDYLSDKWNPLIPSFSRIPTMPSEAIKIL